MFKRTLYPADYLLIAVNLIPVYGVWFEGWSATAVFIAYALETLIVGAFTVIKLGIATIARKTDDWYANGKVSRVSGLVFILFFIAHYGLFAAVQTSMFSVASGINPRNSNFFYFFLHWYEYINKDTIIMLCGFAASYAVRDLAPFLSRGDYRTTSMMLLMFQPYGRIFIQQVIVILGSMFLTFGFDKGFILVFAAVKIIFEVYFGFDKILNKAVSDMEKETNKTNTKDYN
jgi:hypothetical protein